MLHVRNELINVVPSNFRCANVRNVLASACFIWPVLLNLLNSIFFALAMFVIMWLAWQRVHGK